MSKFIEDFNGNKAFKLAPPDGCPFYAKPMFTESLVAETGLVIRLVVASDGHLISRWGVAPVAASD